jgi:hypothetical protein
MEGCDEYHFACAWGFVDILGCLVDSAALSDQAVLTMANRYG